MAEESKEGGLKTSWLTIPKGTAILSAAGPGAPLEREVEERSERVEYYKGISSTVRGRLYHRLVGSGYIAQETEPLGSRGQKRFMDEFGTPIETGKRRVNK